MTEARVPSEQEEEAQNLKSQVLNCLQQSGLPFEARIARAFASLEMDEEYKDFYTTEFGESPSKGIGSLNDGVPVQCSVPYLDPETSKSREIDIHSIIPLRVRDVSLWNHFYVECKNTNKVWVLGHYGYETTPTIRNKYYSRGLDYKYPEAEIELNAFKPDPILGVPASQLSGVGKVLKRKEMKGGITLKNDDRDEIWEASLAAVKAVIDTHSGLIKFLDTARVLDKKILYVYIPMVVTGNQLYFADFSDDLPAVSEVDHAFYIHRSLSSDRVVHNHFVVPIVTETSLTQTVNGIVKASIQFLNEYFLL